MELDFLLDTFMQEGDVLDELFYPVEGLSFCEFETCGARCVTEGESYCPHSEAMKQILERFDRADLIVFTTPTYCYHASSQLKVLLEHTCWRWMRHRPNSAWFKKQVVVIATSAGAGAKKPAQDVVDCIAWLGAARIHTVALSMGAMDWSLATKKKQDRLEQAIEGVVKKLSHNPAEVRTSIGLRGRFALMRMLQKRFPTGEADQAYWKEKGWLDSRGLPR